jgi:hypothetical protein
MATAAVGGGTATSPPLSSSSTPRSATVRRMSPAAISPLVGLEPEGGTRQTPDSPPPPSSSLPRKPFRFLRERGACLGQPC